MSYFEHDDCKNKIERLEARIAELEAERNDYKEALELIEEMEPICAFDDAASTANGFLNKYR